MRNRIASGLPTVVVLLAGVAVALSCMAATAPPSQPQATSRTLTLTPCDSPTTDPSMLCGSYEVYENRARGSGRRIALNVVLLPARAKSPRPDPVLYLAGGPGGSATRRAAQFADSWMRADRDILLVDQRGTGESNPLPCELPGSANDLQGYLDGDFTNPGVFRRCRDQLKRIADLRRYNTPIAVDDLDEVRAALGYEQVNLYGTSWGTRTALIYMRRHPQSVRTAVLSSVVPLSIIYPLYHAAGAQAAFDAIVAECASDSRCNAAYPDLDSELRELFARVDGATLPVTMQDPETGAPVNVELSHESIADGLRYLVWSVEGTRWFPAYVHEAFQGSYAPLAELVIGTKRGARALKVGQLLSVVCPGDVARIDPADIPDLTDGTLFGDGRVRQTLKVCKSWPQPKMPADFGARVESEAPTLIWGGSLDSASRPEWAEAAAQGLANSLVLIVPGAHTPDGQCIDRVTKRFLERAKVTGLGTGCTGRIRLPGFEVSE